MSSIMSLDLKVLKQNRRCGFSVVFFSSRVSCESKKGNFELDLILIFFKTVTKKS